MKLTKSYLRKIIKEETDRVFLEGVDDKEAVEDAQEIMNSDNFDAMAADLLEKHPEVLEKIKKVAAEVKQNMAVQETAIHNEAEMSLGDVASVTTGAGAIATVPGIIAALPGSASMLGTALGSTSLGVFASVTGIGALAGLGLALTAYYLSKTDPSF